MFKRWLYWRVVRLNDWTDGRYWRLELRMLVNGWSDER